MEMMDIVMLCTVTLLVIVDVATFFVIVKIFRMHDSKDEKGEYTWMVPRDWAETNRIIGESHKQIMTTLSELSATNSQSTKLLESLTDAVLRMNQEMKSRS